MTFGAGHNHHAADHSGATGRTRECAEPLVASAPTRLVDAPANRVTHGSVRWISWPFLGSKLRRFRQAGFRRDHRSAIGGRRSVKRRRNHRPSWYVPARPSGLARFRCRTCGATLTGPLRRLDDPATLTGKELAPLVPAGTYWPVATGHLPTSHQGVPVDFAGCYAVRPRALIGVGKHSDRRRWIGCCGTTGTHGPSSTESISARRAQNGSDSTRRVDTSAAGRASGGRSWLTSRSSRSGPPSHFRWYYRSLGGPLC